MTGGGKAGRYFEIDSTVFSNRSYVKVEGSTLLPSLEFKTRRAATGGLSVLDMLRHLNSRSRPLLENWNKEFVWDKLEGVKRTEEGDLETAVSNLTLEESVSKEDLRDELLRTRVADLAIALLNYQHRILMAEHVEIKCALRSMFLSSINQGKNFTLAEALSLSRLSTPQLFGELPESYRHRLVMDNPKFPGFTVPEGLTFTEPSCRKKFQSSPSGNRGAPRGIRASFSQRRTGKRGGRKKWDSYLTSKNVQAGGHSKASRVSTQTTRGGGSTARGSKSRGGKSGKGRARGKFKRK